MAIEHKKWEPTNGSTLRLPLDQLTNSPTSPGGISFCFYDVLALFKDVTGSTLQLRLHRFNFTGSIFRFDVTGSTLQVRLHGFHILAVSLRFF